MMNMIGSVLIRDCTVESGNTNNEDGYINYNQLSPLGSMGLLATSISIDNCEFTNGVTISYTWDIHPTNCPIFLNHSKFMSGIGINYRSATPSDSSIAIQSCDIKNGVHIRYAYGFDDGLSNPIIFMGCTLKMETLALTITMRHQGRAH